MSGTYTYALLDVSAATYSEIDRALKAAGYEHAFCEDDGVIVIDMHGIALRREAMTKNALDLRAAAQALVDASAYAKGRLLTDQEIADLRIAFLGLVGALENA